MHPHRIFILLLTTPIWVLRYYALNLEYDYIIIGGGTSGLVIANRLSESSDISVAVIEAGLDVSQNANVTDPTKFTISLGTDIDWNYKSSPQIYAGDRIIDYHAGKGLGGTSNINGIYFYLLSYKHFRRALTKTTGMTYIRAQKSQIDIWEVVGNPGWNWNTLLPYYKKSEHLGLPTVAQREAGASYNPIYHGENGYLKVGFPYNLLNGSFVHNVKSTWDRLGIPINEDVNGGDVRGFSVWPSTIDRDTNVRESAAKAYYYPILGRPNLKVFLNTTANRIVWKDGAGVATAQGVEITSTTGTIITLYARREVIVSAGSLRSPTILELSGVGNSKQVFPAT